MKLGHSRWRFAIHQLSRGRSQEPIWHVNKRMTVMVEAEFMDEVKEAARNRRMKMSEWIRLVVENELRTEKERRS